MTATATLVHSTATPSVSDVNRLRVARVAAAARLARVREAEAQRDAVRLERALVPATAWIEDLRAAGATEVGFKIICDMGKWRTVRPIADAADFLAHRIADHDDVEAWGLNARGEYVGEVW